MKSPDLFGGESVMQTMVPRQGRFKKWRAINAYREGTKEVRCGTCKYTSLLGAGNGSYYKCELQGITNCASSDIRLKNVCNQWQAEKIPS